MNTRQLLLLFTLLCGMISCVEKPTNEVIITGHLKGVEDGIVISLAREDERMLVDVASDTLTNGKFRLVYTDTIPGPKNMMIMGRGEGFPPTWLDVWVTPGARIEVNGEDKLLRTWTVKSKVKEQKEQNKLQDFIKEEEISSQTIMRNRYALFDKMAANPNEHQEIRAQIDSLNELGDSIQRAILEKELKVLAKANTSTAFFIKNLYKHSMFSTNTSYPFKEQLPVLYNKLSEEQKNSDMGERIALFLNPPTVVKVGDEMADAALHDIEGNIHHLADYKGKHLLLDFWSRGCGPCINAIPEMKEIAETYKEQLTIIGINTDKKEAWIEVSKEKGITWPNFNDPKKDGGLSLHYGVRGIPNYVLISPDGIILDTWMGYGKGTLTKKLQEYF